MNHYQCTAPIVGAVRYRNDVVIVRDGRSMARPATARGEVTTFTKASRRRLAFVAANTDVEFKTMITLTYPRVFPIDGKEVKRHLNAFLSVVRRSFFAQAKTRQRLAEPAIRFSYLWFLEFQRRGAPHIHLLLANECPGSMTGIRVLRDRVAAVWYRIVDSGDERHLRAGTRCEAIRVRDGAARYAVKYAHKMRQKAVPSDFRNVGRFWGHSRDVSPKPLEVISCREDDVRELLGAWPWKPDDDRVVYRVLYGTSSLFKGRGEAVQPNAVPPDTDGTTVPQPMQ